MKFAQMCELPTDSAVTQTASSVPLSQSGDENWRGTGAEKRRPLSKKERGEGGWKRGAECVCMCVRECRRWGWGQLEGLVSFPRLYLAGESIT